jgi:hypothetical protein
LDWIDCSFLQRNQKHTTESPPYDRLGHCTVGAGFDLSHKYILYLYLYLYLGTQQHARGIYYCVLRPTARVHNCVYISADCNRGAPVTRGYVC